MSANPLFDAMDELHKEECYKSHTTIGENGADEYTLYGMGEVKGALVAYFNSTLRTTPREKIVELIDNVKEEALKSYNPSKYMAELICNVFQTRDIRGEVGGGERLVFYNSLLVLYEYYPKTIINLVNLIPEYGYWKDLNKLLEMIQGHGDRDRYLELENRIYEVIIEQIKSDLSTIEMPKEERGKLSLVAKYVPKEGKHTDRATKASKEIARRMFPEEFTVDFRWAMKNYRKVISKLNREINTVEVLMCAKRYDEIRFELVPGRCLNKNRRAWLDEDKKHVRRHPTDEKRTECREHYIDYLKMAVESGKSLKGKSLFIHEIVKVVREKNYKYLSEEDKILLECQFRDHVDDIRKKAEESGTGLDEMVALCDVSGSMEGDPMNVSIGMGIIVSSLAKDEWRNRVLTFEEIPTWVILKYPKNETEFNNFYKSSRNAVTKFPIGIWNPADAGRDLSYLEKIEVLNRAPWGGSTDFLSAFDMILSVGKKYNLEFPKRLIVISDMQFNTASSIGKNKYPNLSGYSKYFEKDLSSDFQTHYQIIRSTLTKFGKRIPEIIFWNVRGNTKGYVASSETEGVQMLSGFSSSLLKLFLNGDEITSTGTEEKNIVESVSAVTPWTTFEKAVVKNSNYDRIREIILQTGEGIFSDYIYEPNS